MKVKITIILGALLLILAVAVLIDSVMHNYSDEPEESDVIIMLGGGDEERMKKAADLYHDGYARHVLITPVIEEEKFTQSVSQAEALGIPEEAIITENDATSTYTNATISFDIMEEHNYDSALIVTTDYHIKRAKYIFDKENENHFDLNYIPAYSENNKQWHERDDAFRLWWRELIKMWGYRFSLYNFINFEDDSEKYQ